MRIMNTRKNINRLFVDRQRSFNVFNIQLIPKSIYFQPVRVPRLFFMIKNSTGYPEYGLERSNFEALG